MLATCLTTAVITLKLRGRPSGLHHQMKFFEHVCLGQPWSPPCRCRCLVEVSCMLQCSRDLACTHQKDASSVWWRPLSCRPVPEYGPFSIRYRTSMDVSDGSSSRNRRSRNPSRENPCPKRTNRQGAQEISPRSVHSCPAISGHPARMQSVWMQSSMCLRLLSDSAQCAVTDDQVHLQLFF